MPRKPAKVPVAKSFSDALKAVNGHKKRQGQSQGSIHYPWLAAGALVDMMDRIFDVQGVKSRPEMPVRAIKYRAKKWRAA